MDIFKMSKIQNQIYFLEKKSRRVQNLLLKKERRETNPKPIKTK
jgi:hypothetical protein